MVVIEKPRRRVAHFKPNFLPLTAYLTIDVAEWSLAVMRTALDVTRVFFRDYWRGARRPESKAGLSAR